MTAVPLARRVLPAARPAVLATTDSPAAPPSAMAVLAAASLATLALTLLWALVEPRLIDGEPVWLKPAKFAASFVLTFGTLALVQARLSAPWRDGWTLRIAALLMTAGFAFETVYMTFQAARAEASHFNFATPRTTFMYSLMGVGAVTLVLCIAAVGAVTLLDREARLSLGVRVAAGLGLVAGGLLTLGVAGWMSANGSHFVGVPPEGAATVPLMGWSLAVGDFRPAHFAALHAMQAIPLYALWRERRGARVATAEVAGVAALWCALTLGLFAQAYLGLPIIRL